MPSRMKTPGVRVHEAPDESEYCTDTMCARYQTPGQAAAERYWQVIEPLWNFEASWRVLPTQQIPIILALNGVTTGRMMRWGLIPNRSLRPSGKAMPSPEGAVLSCLAELDRLAREAPGSATAKPE